VALINKKRAPNKKPKTYNGKYGYSKNNKYKKTFHSLNPNFNHYASQRARLLG